MNTVLSQEAAPHWAVIWAKSARNPLLFVTDLLKATPEDWQREALQKIAQHDRLSIRAGHGVGKTTFIAWVVLWFMLTRMPYKVPITANSQDQLRDVVWPELRKWRDRLPEPLRNQIVIEAERIWLKGLPESFAVARTASKDNPEALQGFHDENLLFVIEEASGIDDVVFEVAQGAMSTPGAKILMCGNPTRTSGYFYDTHHTLRNRWETMRVNSEDVPRARGHIEDVIAKYGKESNVYRVRVLGEFPDSEDDVVIPLHLCEAAIGRKVAPPDLIRPVWGLDVARFGSDRTALAKRRGNVQLEPIRSWRGKDTMQTAGLIAKEYEDADKLDRPSEILVDVIGIGAGVVDRLNELGLPVRGINVAEAAAVSERFMRLRDELWFKAREWLEAKDSKLCDDQALVGELTAAKYEITSGGKIKVEGKDDMKKRGVLSPDLADCWCLTFAGGLDRRDAEEIDRYRHPQRRSGSAWAV